MDELSFLLTIIIVLLAGMGVGALVVLLFDNRIRRYRLIMSEYRETHNLIADNTKLVKENEELKKTTANQASEILRYRQAMTTHADQKRIIGDMQKSIEEMKKTIAKLRQDESARFGRLIKFLANKGISLTDAELKEITP